MIFAQNPAELVGNGHKRQIKDLLRQTQDLVNQAFERTDEQQPVMRELVEYHQNVDYVDMAGGMFGSVRREVLFINGQIDGFHPADIERFRGQIAAMLDRNIALSLICHPDKLGGHGRQPFLEELSKNDGAEVRISAVKLHGTFVFDRRWVLMWSPQRDRHCMLVRSPTIVEPLLRLTDTAWETACDLDTFVRCRMDELDEKTPQTLQLLSSGCKDEVAARELGVSVRTYRRYVADLMAKLDSGSRFQAGVRAAELGLISPTRATCRPTGRSAPPEQPAQRRNRGKPDRRLPTNPPAAPSISAPIVLCAENQQPLVTNDGHHQMTVAIRRPLTASGPRGNTSTPIRIRP